MGGFNIAIQQNSTKPHLNVWVACIFLHGKSFMQSSFYIIHSSFYSVTSIVRKQTELVEKGGQSESLKVLPWSYSLGFFLSNALHSLHVSSNLMSRGPEGPRAWAHI